MMQASTPSVPQIERSASLRPDRIICERGELRGVRQPSLYINNYKLQSILYSRGKNRCGENLMLNKQDERGCPQTSNVCSEPWSRCVSLGLRCAISPSAWRKASGGWRSGQPVRGLVVASHAGDISTQHHRERSRHSPTL